MIRGFVFAIAVFILTTTSSAQKPEEKITYQDHVQPIFRARCFSCHNTNKKEGDLDLTNYTNLMQGGGSGAVIEPGASSDSYLFALITHQDEPAMPPETDKMPAEELSVIEKWIDNGALETKSSKSMVKKKKSFDFALADPSSGRPSVVATPAKQLLDPYVVARRSTSVTAMATSPWAPLVAIAGQKQILVYDTKTGELKGILPFPEGQANVLKFSRSGALLLAGGGRAGASGKVILFNVVSGERVIEVGDELETVLAADINSDHSLVALGGPQKMVRVYSTATGELQYEIKKHTDWVTALEFSPDGVLLATGDRVGGVHVWEGYTGRPYLTLKAHSKQVVSISWRLDSNLVATASEDTTVRLWELENGAQVKNWGAHGGGVLSMEFSRDGRVFTCGRDKVCKMWNQNGQAVRQFEGYSDIAVNLTHCDETDYLISGDWTGEIRMHNAKDGKRITALTSNPPKLQARLEQANALVATSTTENTNAINAYKASMANLANAQKGLTDAQNLVKTLTTTIAQHQATQKTLAASIPQETTKVANTKKQIAMFSVAVPALKIASDNAAAAQKQFPTDPELVALAKSSAQAYAKRKATMDAANAEVIKLDASLKTMKAKTVEVAKLITTSTAQMKTGQQTIAKITPTIKPLTDANTKAKQVADAAAAKLAQAQQQVAKWNSAIQFANEYKKLKTNLLASIESQNAKFEGYSAAVTSTDEVKKEVVAKKATMDQMMANMKTLQGNMTAKTNVVNDLTQKVSTSQNQIKALTAELATSTKLIPSIQEAKAKIEAALAIAPSDADVKNQVALVSGLLQKKEARKNAIPAEMETMKKLLATQQAGLTTAKTEQVAATNALNAGKVALAKSQADHSAAEEKRAEAEQKAIAAKAELDAAEKGVLQVKQLISKLQGISG